MLRQLRLDQKEVDLKRKRDVEEINKMRDDEMLKIRKEKKVLEQRFKNMQFASSNGAHARIEKEAEQLRR